MQARILSGVSVAATIGTTLATDMVRLVSDKPTAYYELYGDGYFHDLAPYLFEIAKTGCDVVISETKYHVKMSCTVLASWHDFMVEHITLCHSYLHPASSRIEECLHTVINSTFHAIKQNRQMVVELAKQQEELARQQFYDSLVTGAGYLVAGIGLFAVGHACYRGYKRYTHVATFDERLEKINYKGTIDNDFICPISQLIMDDPVLATDGFNYDRMHLERWLAIVSASPITRVEINPNELAPNDELRKQIDAFVTAEEKKHAKQLDELEQANFYNQFNY